MVQYGLLEGLTEQQRGEVEALLRPVRLAAGETVVREGEYGDALYLVEEGQLEVVKGHGEHRLTQLGSGDDFGTLALLGDEPRSATVRTLGEAQLLALSVHDLRALSNEVTDSAYVVLLRNQLARRHADLRRSSDTAVDSLERQLEEARKRVEMGSLLGFIIFVMCAYNFVLRDSIDAITAAGESTPVTVGLIVFYVATLYAMMRRSGYPLRIYGLSLDNWQRSVRQALLWSAVFVALLTSLKWLFIRLLPSWQNLPLFELYGLEQLSLREGLLIAGLYSLFAPAQEFVARGALQSSFRELLAGRFVTTRAIAYSTLMFSAMHVHLSTSFALMALVPSVFWGILYARQGTLVGVSISHVLIGLWTVFLLGLPGLA